MLLETEAPGYYFLTTVTYKQILELNLYEY